MVFDEPQEPPVLDGRLIIINKRHEVSTRVSQRFIARQSYVLTRLHTVSNAHGPLRSGCNKIRIYAGSFQTRIFCRHISAHKMIRHRNRSFREGQALRAYYIRVSRRSACCAKERCLFILWAGRELARSRFATNQERVTKTENK
jgi:hypothetical protein